MTPADQARLVAFAGTRTPRQDYVSTVRLFSGPSPHPAWTWGQWPSGAPRALRAPIELRCQREPHPRRKYLSRSDLKRIREWILTEYNALASLDNIQASVCKAVRASGRPLPEW